MDWTDVKEAIDKHTLAYNEYTKARRDERTGTKKVEKVYQAWVAAHAERYEALLKHWTEEDGWWVAEQRHTVKSVGETLRRYYEENAAIRPQKRGKKA